MITKTIPMDAANTTSIVGRYHEPPRCAHITFCINVPYLIRNWFLQAAIKFITDSIDPHRQILDLFNRKPMPRFGFLFNLKAAPITKRAKSAAKTT